MQIDKPWCLIDLLFRKPQAEKVLAGCPVGLLFAIGEFAAWCPLFGRTQEHLIRGSTFFLLNIWVNCCNNHSIYTIVNVCSLNFKVFHNVHWTLFVYTPSIIRQISFPSFADMSNGNIIWQVTIVKKINSTKPSKQNISLLRTYTMATINSSNFKLFS